MPGVDSAAAWDGRRRGRCVVLHGGSTLPNGDHVCSQVVKGLGVGKDVCWGGRPVRHGSVLNLPA
eukprot:358065-Chlamydomonas_euryale.AAC.6